MSKRFLDNPLSIHESHSFLADPQVLDENKQGSAYHCLVQSFR
jgi:hypothetical protein